MVLSFKIDIISSIIRESFGNRFCDCLNIADEVVIKKIASLKVSKNFIGINDISFVYIGKLDESGFINKYLDGDAPFDMIFVDEEFIEILKKSKLFEKKFIVDYEFKSLVDKEFEKDNDIMDVEYFKVSREFDSYYDDASREIIKMIG